tara:strand:+ start:627 stop:917 length:291 start_codon:yes stop_codon:yes gene_type:complete
MRFALAIVFGALPCQAFRPWTRPAWEGVAIVKQVTSAEPSPACLAEGALAEPAFAGNDKLVFEFLKGLSATDKKTLWRTARWYNYLVELTLPEDEE